MKASETELEEGLLEMLQTPVLRSVFVFVFVFVFIFVFSFLFVFLSVDEG